MDLSLPKGLAATRSILLKQAARHHCRLPQKFQGNSRCISNTGGRLIAGFFASVWTGAAIVIFSLILTLVNKIQIGGDEFEAPFGIRPSFFFIFG
jgi:hypothetical protein